MASVMNHQLLYQGTASGLTPSIQCGALVGLGPADPWESLGSAEEAVAVRRLQPISGSRIVSRKHMRQESEMSECESSNHAQGVDTFDHVVFIPGCRRKVSAIGGTRAGQGGQERDPSGAGVWGSARPAFLSDPGI